MWMFSGKGNLYLHPFLPYDNPKEMVKRLSEELAAFKISKQEIAKSLALAYQEQENYKQDMKKAGIETL